MSKGEQPANILLVDDRAEELLALEVILDDPGYRVISARSGEEALRHLLGREEFALILLDVMMPGIDGFETADLIRSRERSRAIPIIFLTGHASEEKLSRGYAAGAVDYVVKPVIAEVLRSKVAVFVELSRKSALIARQADKLERRERAARQLARRRAELLRELERKNSELEAFGYSVSHDLRAPLRSIEGFAKALAVTCAEKLDAEGLDYLRRIRSAAGRMEQIIAGLLDLSQMGRVPLVREPVDLSAIAEQIVAELRAAEPGRRVEVRITQRLVGAGDPRLLRLVIENLLGNAWKFTARRPEGCIEFDGERGPSETTVRVRDNGVGFDMAEAAKLFRPFRRLHDPEEFPGTGIGLATVQRIIDSHGGRIWADAVPDGGATFCLSLPAPPETDLDPASGTGVEGRPRPQEPQGGDPTIDRCTVPG